MITSDRCAVHDFVLCYGVVLVVDVWPRAGGLALDDVNLHMFDLNPHQQEVNLPYNHIFKMIPARKRYDLSKPTRLYEGNRSNSDQKGSLSYFS